MKLTNPNPAIPDVSWDPRSQPDRDKLDLQFQHLKDDSYKLTMIIPLDPSLPAEAEAARLFGLGGRNSLVVRSEITLDFEAEKLAFIKILNQLYDSDIGQALSSDILQQISDAHLREWLNPLIDQGQSVFYRLFISNQILYEKFTDDDVPILKAAIKSAFSRPQVLSIYDDNPLFPWAFLYNDEDYDPTNRLSIKPERFWGFMHEVQEELPVTPARIHLSPDLEIITAVDSYIDTEGVHDSDDYPFSKVKTRSAHDIHQLRDELTNFQSHCLYFFGHADHADPPTPSTSWLELLATRLMVSELERREAPQFKNNPVVGFLNGCNTSPLTCWNDSSLVGYLCIRGKKHLCCVASVGALPATFALEFARAFWEEFLCGKHIGTALLSARRDMLKRWNNPLGLLYSLFGRVDTHISINDCDQTAPGFRPSTSRAT